MSPLKATVIGFAVSLIFCIGSFSQVSSSTPKQFIRGSHLDLALGIGGLELPYNRPEQIRQELQDTNIIRLIASGAGLAEADLTTIVIAPWQDTGWITLFQLKKPDKAFEVLNEQLRAYVQAREDGHTKAFLHAAITNAVSPLSIADFDLRVLMQNKPFIPVSWIHKSVSGTHTNRAGQIASITTTTTIINGQMKTTAITNTPKLDEICRWSSYKVTDGQIEWIYVLDFNAMGHLDRISESRIDAKEDDPKFQKIIKEVENEVNAKMKQNGTFGKFGSVHEFWSLKKEKLKARGIDRRSPVELNPGTAYD